MAWNQPGGNGGRDPWGDRGGQQGPPDLDEVLNKLQARLGRIFGQRGGGGSSSGGGFNFFGAGGAIGLGVVAVIAVLAWFAFGIYIVDPAEEAVVLRFGQYSKTVGPGPHWRPPFIDNIEKVNVEEVRSQEVGLRTQGSTQTKVPHEALMLTEDENIIDIQFTVQYRVTDPANFLFKVDDPQLTLRQATESAVREVVGRSRMDFVITEGRDAVAAEAEGLIQEILDRYETGINVTSVNMQDAQPPGQVQNAFFDAIKAREDQERVINEANAYKNDKVPKARGSGEAILERAEGYRQRVEAIARGEAARFLEVLAEYKAAPEVTRERLYIEAVERVMANSSKVLVDVKGGNSLMYLPIDQLMSNRGRGVVSEPDGIDSDIRNTPRPTFDNSRRSRESTDERSR